MEAQLQVKDTLFLTASIVGNYAFNNAFFTLNKEVNLSGIQLMFPPDNDNEQLFFLL